MNRLIVFVLRNTEFTAGVFRKCKFDQHGGLVADDPAFVPWLDRDELGRSVLFDATVGELDVDLALGHEPDMRVLAKLAADDGREIGGPIEAGLVNHALDENIAGFKNVDVHAASFVVLIGSEGREEGF